MPRRSNSGSRRQEILETLARMLEATPGGRITTAALARELGVSEAALYRHFPSKSKIFEGLIVFIEETIFSRVNRVLEEQPDGLQRCQQILALLLLFCERNPGMCRILTGDALVGETERLRQRVATFYDRLETQLRQILRDAEHQEGQRTAIPVALAANLMLACAEGRITQFVRSGFRRPPTEYWDEQWKVLTTGFYRERVV
jgi:TetR/AcrR family transcriptional regulator